MTMTPDEQATHRSATELTRSVARVLDAAGMPSGTGFLVAERILATCAHVVADNDGRPPPGSVSVEFTGLPGAAAEVRAGQVNAAQWRGPHEGDVAFLWLTEPPPAWACPLLLGSAHGIRSHGLKTFGFAANAPPEGSYGYATAGDIIAGADGRELLQLTGCTEVTEGFSGGPVLDQQTGLVVGMVELGRRPGPPRPGQRDRVRHAHGNTARDLPRAVFVGQLPLRWPAGVPHGGRRAVPGP